MRHSDVMRPLRWGDGLINGAGFRTGSGEGSRRLPVTGQLSGAGGHARGLGAVAELGAPLVASTHPKLFRRREGRAGV